MISTEPKPMTKKRVLRISGVIALILGLIAAAAGWWLDVSGLIYFGIAALVTGAAWLVSSRFACDEPMRPEARRYMREFFPAIFAYLLILFGGWSHIHDTQSVALKWVIALLPALPVFLILRAMLRLLLASDELEQRMQLQAIAISAMSVGLVSFAAAFLVAADLLPVDNLLMLVLPALIGVYGVALTWIKRQYRDD
ncbi:MAG: hypothetical protein WBW92_03110 [Rhodanobacteraceae bacterium]